MHDPIFLSMKSEVATKEDLQVAEDLLDTLIAHKDGCVGMAANIIGVRKRIIAFDNEGTYMVMFNPEIIKKSEPYETEEYPANNGYLAYMTRGCINKCAFCAVPKLEPEYKDYLPLCEQIKESEKRFGAKRDLLLLDNNVLASCQFNKIIDEIVEAGFGKDSKYIPPNKYEIAIQNIKDNFNKRAYIKAVVKEYQKLVEKYGKKIQDIYDLLDSKFLLNDYTAKEKNILAVHEAVKPWFEEFYKSNPKKRNDTES